MGTKCAAQINGETQDEEVVSGNFFVHLFAGFPHP